MAMEEVEIVDTLLCGKNSTFGNVVKKKYLEGNSKWPVRQTATSAKLVSPMYFKLDIINLLREIFFNY